MNIPYTQFTSVKYSPTLSSSPTWVFGKSSRPLNPSDIQPEMKGKAAKKCDVPSEKEEEKINANDKSDEQPKKHKSAKNHDVPSEKEEECVETGDSDEPIILRRLNTTDISIRRSARVQQKKNKVKALVKEAKDKYTKKVASPFILGESSITYRAPQGFYGSFGAKEKNVRPNPVHMDDDYDDADEGEMSSSCEMVKIKKPKKEFIDNQVVFTDEEMEMDSTLKNNIGKNIEKLQEEDLNISK